ncbi:Eco29kI family restriction endonuclease [Rhizobium rhizosphaerae]|uniref:Eco29kI family restriction endonuclease n=1 Tax=Xaviernesmea rhizosphaerae TaxID=1672749 RepID=UPI0009BF4B35
MYYIGEFPAHAPIRTGNLNDVFSRPIYIRKAIPKGGRKGGLSSEASTGRSLADRLAQHTTSIEHASNLRIEDLLVRFLVVDDIWNPLGENILIETFKPLWSRAIDGFGNRDTGKRRATQYRSPWGVLHPGRAVAAKLAESPLTEEFLRRRVSDYISGKALEKLPKVIEEQQAAEEADAQQTADEV